MTVNLLFLFALVCACLCQVQNVELYSSDNSLPYAGSVQGLFADLNCSTFANTVIKVQANLPNFNNPIGQAIMYVGVAPATGGRYAPFPDPLLPSTFKYTTLQPNFTISPYITFNTAGAQDLFITMYCDTSQCEYNVVISQATSSDQIETKVSTHVPVLPPKDMAKRDSAIEVKRLMLRNRIIVDGVVNYWQWATVMLPICGNTLSSIYGPTATVCLESTVIGTQLGYLFYQQISTYSLQNPNVPKWYQRQPDTQEPIRDLTGTQKLPVNRYRTTPIGVSDLIPVSYVYHSVVGEGGEGTSAPYPNYYIASYEWFECTT